MTARGKALIWLSNCLEDKMQSTGINDPFSQWREMLDGVGFSKGQCWDMCCSEYLYITWEKELNTQVGYLTTWVSNEEKDCEELIT